ncbi:MAG: hypothetical protein E6600_04705 [Anaerocolumna aminovalerica]|uniref:hypothetical protein n=1 Tax=Anaerocolumna aminovalerica TaxID=1527 RepID=UPI0029143D79|nr:hypothetical protein [Anaerocolumna aminovalerica]MDU6263783.1 hypothetical protein [Anaerocolumna aminovalerica]
MEQKILNLLSLCLEAKKQGVNVFFNYSPHVQSIRIHIYKDCNYEALSPDELPDRLVDEDIYIDYSEELVCSQIDRVINAINKIILEKSGGMGNGK